LAMILIGIHRYSFQSASVCFKLYDMWCPAGRFQFLLGRQMACKVATDLQLYSDIP